jgi:hypothetical protein
MSCIFQFLSARDHSSLSECSCVLSAVARLSTSSPVHLDLNATSRDWRPYFRPKSAYLKLERIRPRSDPKSLAAHKLYIQAGALLSKAHHVRLYVTEFAGERDDSGEWDPLKAYCSMVEQFNSVQLLEINGMASWCSSLFDNDVGHRLRRLQLVYMQPRFAHTILRHCVSLERLHVLLVDAELEYPILTGPEHNGPVCPHLRVATLHDISEIEWVERRFGTQLEQLCYRSRFRTDLTSPQPIAESMQRLAIPSQFLTFSGPWPKLRELFLYHNSMDHWAVDLSQCPELRVVTLAAPDGFRDTMSRHGVRLFVTSLHTCGRTSSETLCVMVDPILVLRQSSPKARILTVAYYVRKLVRKAGDHHHIDVYSASYHLDVKI